MDLKEWLVPFITSLGLSLSAFISGSFGGIISNVENDKRTKKETFWALFVGGFTAGYLAPVVKHYLNIEESFLGAIGFVIGLVSMYLVHLIQYIFHNEKEFLQLVKEFILFKNKKP